MTPTNVSAQTIAPTAANVMTIVWHLTPCHVAIFQADFVVDVRGQIAAIC